MRWGRVSRLIAIAAGAIGLLVAPPSPALAVSAPSAPGVSAPAAPALTVAVPRLSVRAAILIDGSTGQELYGVAPNLELPIASTTKLMTALITLQHVRHLSRTFTQFDYVAAAGDSQIGLLPGERMSVHDLLLAIMLPSADDAAEDLAYNVGHGSVGRFLAMMNAQARALGLRHTHYTTPVGFDTPGNYSTAADLVKLAAYDLSDSRYFSRIVALPRAVLYSGRYVRTIVNRNDLVGRVPWINGVKTGHTSAAGYVMIAAGQRHGIALISAVLGTTSEQARDANTMALLDYGFAAFHRVRPIHAGQVLTRRPVSDQPGVRVPLIAARGFTQVVARGPRIEVQVQAPRRLTGPLRRHAEVGTVTVLVGGRPVARIPLLLAQALPAVSGLTLATRFITKPTMLLTIVAAGVALAVALLAWRRRSRLAARRWEAA